jgi:hypothetical protein
MKQEARAARAVSRGWITLLAVLQLVILVLPPLSTRAAEGTRTLIQAGDSPSLGPKDAPVTIIKFTDYQ